MVKAIPTIFAANYWIMQNRTREILKKLGVKQVELAEKLGMTTVGINQLMRTDQPKIETLEKIASAIDVPVWQLYLTDEEIEEVIAQHGKEQAKQSNMCVCPHCGNIVHVEMTL